MMHTKEAHIVEDELSDIDVTIYVTSACLDGFVDSLKLTFERLKNDYVEDSPTPTLKIFKFNENLINIVLRHLINGKPTDLVDTLRESCKNDYEVLESIADEINEHVIEAGYGLAFNCTNVNIMYEGLIQLTGRFSDEL